MPSDLYNLNSSYGSVEELKYCIEEMHSQDLLVCCAGNWHIKLNIWRFIVALQAINFFKSYNNQEFYGFWASKNN